MPKSNLKLIKALRSAADMVENKPSAFDWGKMESCNCGIVAQKLLGKNKQQIHTALYSEHQGGLWSDRANKDKCALSGLPISKIVRDLLKAGMKIKDFYELEFLSNGDVLKETDIDVEDDEYFGRPNNLVKYLRAWANILCRNECQKKETANA